MKDTLFVSLDSRENMLFPIKFQLFSSFSLSLSLSLSCYLHFSPVNYLYAIYLRPRKSSPSWHVSSIITCLCHLVSLPFSLSRVVTLINYLGNIHPAIVIIAWSTLSNQSIALFHVFASHSTRTCCLIMGNNTIYPLEPQYNQLDTTVADKLSAACKSLWLFVSSLSSVYLHCLLCLSLSPCFFLSLLTRKQMLQIHTERQAHEKFIF